MSGPLITSLQVHRTEGADRQPAWVIELGTRGGLRGLGEVIAEAQPDSLARLLSDWGSRLVGKDSAAIGRLCQKLALQGDGAHGTVAVGIQMALWDLQGKRLRVPVHQFFGGPVRERIRACARVVAGSTAEAAARQAGAAAGQGMTAVSWCPRWDPADSTLAEGLHQVAVTLRAMRDAVGTTVDLVLDLTHFHCAEPLPPTWLRDLPTSLLLNPWPDSSPRVIAQRANSLPLPIGVTAESSQTSSEMLREHAAGVLLIRPSQAGGMLAARNIFSAAEVYFVSGIISSMGGWLETLPSVHLAACVPNLVFLEIPASWCASEHNLPWPLAWDSPGHLRIPELDGWGADPDWQSRGEATPRPRPGEVS